MCSVACLSTESVTHSVHAYSVEYVERAMVFRKHKPDDIEVEKRFLRALEEKRVADVLLEAALADYKRQCAFENMT